MSDWMATLGLLSVTGGAGLYDLSPPDVTGVFDAPPVVQWIVPLPTPPLASATHTERSGPLLHGEHIYVGAAGADGLFVLDRRDGQLLRQLAATAPVSKQVSKSVISSSGAAKVVNQLDPDLGATPISSVGSLSKS